MEIRLIWKDVTRNKAVSLMILLFVSLSAMLLSLASILGGNLFGSIDRLMQEAKTPHFMQMHSGQFDRDILEKFAAEYGGVTQFQVLNFLNIDSSEIVIEGQPLTDSLQDNGFCTQSESFDFLLDLDYNRVQPKDGELYVPVFYRKDRNLSVGDQVMIHGNSFTIAGFVRDSQMNSALAYSKRFVVSGEDYKRLDPFGAVEYLIEFRLDDLENLGSFSTAYSAAGLPANGPAISWPLFRMMSAISDGIMIGAILLISVLVILIALLCIRFTLLAKIEDDYREIGVMKAIGIRVSGIRRIYLITYGVLAAAGGILGFFLSLLFYKPMTESIRRNLGSSGNQLPDLLLGGLGIIFLFLLILLFVNANMRRFGRISAAEALRSEYEDKNATGNKGFYLSKNRWISTNLFLAVQDIWARKRLYGTILTVTILAAFIIIVPQNLYHTISAENFVTYMGVGRCDLRVDIQQEEKIEEKASDIAAYMEKDTTISQYTVLTTKTFGVRLENGEVENIKIELGDHEVFPLQYAQGNVPLEEDEIALSSMNAEEWGKSVGDRLVIITPIGEKVMTVSGIYSDITNGGKTAKAVFKDHVTETAWSVICAELGEKQMLDPALMEYGERFSYARVSGIDDYMMQTFGQTLKSVKSAAIISVIAAAAVTFLVTLLFLKLLISKDRYSIAVMKVMGFTNMDVGRQYGWRVMLVLFIGIVFGTMLAGTLGERMAAAMIASFGAAEFRFVVNPLTTYLLCPAVMMFAAVTGAAGSSSRISKLQISELIKE